MAWRSEFFLARKYLRPRRNAVSIITLISIIGVMLGVAVLVIVLSVMTGFINLTEKKILDTQSHAQISRQYAMTDYQDVVDFIDKLGGSTAPVINAPVLMQIKNRFDPKVLLAVTPEDVAKHYKITPPSSNKQIIDPAQTTANPEDAQSILIDGSFDLNRGDVVISQKMAAREQLQIGDKILLHSAKRLSDLVKVAANGSIELQNQDEIMLPNEFTVAGIYNMGKYDFDSSIIFVSLDDGAEVFNLPPGSATEIFAWFRNPDNMDSEVAAFKDRFDGYYQLVTWRQLNVRWLTTLETEKRMMFFMLIFIVLVAAFSITNTLITEVYQKIGEIGILRALGVTTGGIMRIFVFQGMFVGVLGSLFGVSAGFLVITYRNNILRFGEKIFNRPLFPPEFYFFDGLPAQMVWSDIVIIGLSAVVLCTIGAMIPAFYAARLDPAKALRHE